MIRKIARILSLPVIWLLRPVKIYAYCTRFALLRRFILELTTAVDFGLIFANIQNGAMRLHHQVFRGNYIFGKSVMIVGHARASQEIPRSRMRVSRFMGVHTLVHDPAVFVTNAGPISTSQPARGVLRRHMDEQFFTPEITTPDFGAMHAACTPILLEWAQDPKMAASLWPIRGTVTRLVVKLLAKKDISRAEADRVTAAYLRRVGEFSVFGYYAPWLLGLLGSREGIRRDAFRPLQERGVDNLVIDMTLFAAMFSVGTIVIKSVEFTATYDIDYAALDRQQRVRFVIEALRLYPTVTCVHRILEEPEQVEVCGRVLQLRPGDEVAYPFVCINRDPARFADPDAFRLDRPDEEVEAVLSWSKGPHACPVKDLSVLLTVLMLDTLATRYDLRKLKIFDLEF
ncbi:MAG TPA: cytochrome P450 [Opitutaceae bacterium]